MNVQTSDKGFYMCQINADPMIKQTGYLDVLGESKKIIHLILFKIVQKITVFFSNKLTQYFVNKRLIIANISLCGKNLIG